MNGTNCPNCDRADCPMLSCSAVRGTMASNRAMADCANHTVDWRSRALAAEAALAEVKATADRLADFFARQPSDYRLGLRHGAQRAVEAAAGAKP